MMAPTSAVSVTITGDSPEARQATETQFALVRVVRAPGDRNGQVVMRVEVSSDGGETWRQLPTAEGTGGIVLRTQKGHLTTVEMAIAVARFLGGSVELDREAGF